MLLRIGKRRTSRELRSAANFCVVEFSKPSGGFDLTPSVYDVDETEILRTHVEHCAGAGLNPPNGSIDYDVSGLYEAPLTVSPGNRHFAHARSTHRELRFNSKQELLGFTERLLREISNRSQEVEKVAMRSFVKARLGDRDPEWVQFCDTTPRGEKWRNWASKALA